MSNNHNNNDDGSTTTSDGIAAAAADTVVQQGRYYEQEKVIGTDLFSKVRNAKVLVVGAGGIGCELLKNLAMTGFSNIHVIDLDTIDISNLNRQFLFQKQHVGQPKAVVAAEAVSRFNPSGVKLTAEVGNIKSPEFNASFFKRFDLVINALDNIEARRHVNRMCLSVGIGLVESGTAGYLGQVQVIQKGVTECYECQPKPRPKQYPYCTIRSNPSLPIHCIIWAKEEFQKYFGESKSNEKVANNNNNSKENSSSEEEADEEEALDDEDYKRDEEALRKIRTDSGYGHWLFHKLFHTEIFKKVRLAHKTSKDIWKGRPPPNPLRYSSITSSDLQHSDASSKTNNEATTGQLKDQIVWSIKQNAEVFIATADKLVERAKKEKGLSWDKDDDDALNFVTSASNLRSHIFSISPLKSRFDTKAEAGNIIPAIATTNAIIAGMIVMEALKVLANKIESCKYTYLLRKPSNKRLLLAIGHEKPNPNCYVCSSKTVYVQLNTNEITLEYFITEILKKNMGMSFPSIYKKDQAVCVYECGEDLEEDEIDYYARQCKKTLKDLGMIDLTVSVLDFLQDLELDLYLSHNEELAEGVPFDVSSTRQSGQKRNRDDDDNNEDADKSKKKDDELGGAPKKIKT
eukprot:TRINITY_DN7645_c0_g1_i3.p1 TRINITY_DN7645_c0_g1~~TRINITY_DN7645_c0_g1_i3.p1  ORF type:complete len:630 (+),score=158.34 TRINITY_DN7645_c0_g1_i3:38-1927(+)